MEAHQDKTRDKFQPPKVLQAISCMFSYAEKMSTQPSVLMIKKCKQVNHRENKRGMVSCKKVQLSSSGNRLRRWRCHDTGISLTPFSTS